MKVYDSDSPKTALLNGDVDLGVVWSGEAALLYNEDQKFKYVLPGEGAHLFIDSLAIPANAPNPDGGDGVHELHPAPRGQQADLRRLPLHQPEPRGAQAASPEELAEPRQLSARQSEARRPSRDIGDSAVPIDKLVTDLKARELSRDQFTGQHRRRDAT